MTLIDRYWWPGAAAKLQELRWLHLHGPAKTGKSAFATWVAKNHGLADHEVLRINGKDLPAGTPTEPGLALSKVLEELGFDAVGASDPDARQDLVAKDFWPGLIAALTAADRRLCLIIDDIDALLVSSIGIRQVLLSYAGDQADPDGRLNLVTTGSFPLWLTLPHADLFETGVRSGTEDVAARWLDPNDDGTAADLECIASSMEIPKPLVEKLTEAADGHPGLTFELIGIAIFSGMEKAPPNRVMPALRHKVTDHHDQALFPWLFGVPQTAIEAELQIVALKYYMGDPLGEEETVEGYLVARALGLVSPVFGGEPPQLDEGQAPIDPNTLLRPIFLEDLLLKGLEATLRQRLLRLETEYLHHLKSAEAQADNAADTVLAKVQDLVQRGFCDTPRGRARDTKIVGTAIGVIPGQQYVLTLSWAHDSDTPTDTAARGYSHLRLFYGLPDVYRDTWQREFAILREVSSSGHPSLPDIRQNSTIEDQSGEDTTYGFILFENEGREIDDLVYDFFRRPENRANALREVRSLIYGLVQLQSRGLVHRMISPSTLRYHEKGAGDIRLAFGGFDIATGAHLASGSERQAADRPLTARLMNTLVGSPANRRFVDPFAQPMFYDDEAVHHPQAVMPQSDVYSLCMTLCQIFYGPPPTHCLDAFVNAQDGLEGKERLEHLLRAYCKAIRDSPTTVISSTLREIILSGVDPDAKATRTAIDLQRAMLANNAVLIEEYQSETNATFILIYHRENMLTELGRNLRHVLDFDPEAAHAEAKLERFLENKLRRAEYIIRDPAGFTRFVTDEGRVTEAQGLAKIVIVCEQISFYCDYALKRGGVDLGQRVLELRYTLDRGNHALAALVPEDQKVDFPTSSFKLFPHDAPELMKGDIDALADFKQPIANWKAYLASLRDANVPTDLQVAYDAMHFVIEIAWQARRLMQFPVEVRQDTGHDAIPRVILDEQAFNKDIDRNAYRSLLFGDARMGAKSFFQMQLVTWMENNSGPDAVISFQPKDSAREVRISGLEASDVMWGEVRPRRRYQGLQGKGKLVFSDDHGLRTLYRRQLAALAKLRTASRVLEQLNAPQPTMALSRSMPPGFGQDLKGGAAKIIWDMVNAHPLFLLQGPPGTGKTRALSEYIHHVLANEDTSAKILVTAQSHATVDTIMERVAETLDRKSKGDPDARFHMIRHMSGERQDPVAGSMQEAFADEKQVDRLAKAMRRRATERMQELRGIDTPGAKLEIKALERFKSAGEAAYDEIERRFKRNASIHFVTTSSSQIAAAEAIDSQQSFHTAVVEEAATGWGASLIQPMVEARAAILIGDHKQIGPFDARRLIRLAEQACGSVRWDDAASRTRRQARPIFPQYQDDQAVMTRWMEPFRRIFERIERGEFDKVQRGVAVANTLDTQFRSVREIGNLVSDTFYQDEQVNWGGVEFDADKAVLDLTRMKNVRIGSQRIAWLDTDRIGARALQRPNDKGRIENKGEIEILQKLLRDFRRGDKPIVSDDGNGSDHMPVNEKLLILSPYRSQLAAIRLALSNQPEQYGFSTKSDVALAQVAAVTSTIDAAQGSEADTVIVSLARSVDIDQREMPDAETGTPEDWVRAVRRNYGFLAEPERINVMLSRARQQLVIIGNFEFFGSLPADVEAWAASYGRGSRMHSHINEQHGFWSRLVAHFDAKDASFVVQPATEGRPRFD